jgi:gliding motility-associated-like protein
MRRDFPKFLLPHWAFIIMHRTPSYRTSFLTVTLCCMALASAGQNLVPNPDFETQNGCPNGPDGIQDGFAPPWVDGNGGSSDYFHVCSDHASSTVPDNSRGFQWPLSGDAYAGFVLKAEFPPNDEHEYMQTQLLEPLLAGQTYEVAFYVNLANPFCGIDKIGALFTTLPPPYPPGDDNMYLDYDPQIESQSGFLSDTVAWMLIYGCFIAAGGEEYITIGNFQPNVATPEDPTCNTNFNIVYYFLEDVSVRAVDPTFFEIELDGPVEACGFYEIDPGYPDAFLTWSDGSHGPTLTVTESGTYSVTIADACFYAEDEIEVTILNTDPVSIEPDEVTICLNGVYSITLDPDAGDYIWSDGSTSAEYNISSPGIYSVTLDDGCNISSDEITVYELAPPNPIDLGFDQNICDGDAITLSVAPDEGSITWHDNSAAAEYVVTSAGTYSVTISNDCGIETDAIVFNHLDAPEIDLPDVVPNLCVGSIYDISIDPGVGEILWQDGSNDNYYVITESGVYSVTITNQCGSASDEMNVQFFEEPSFAFGPDTLLCPGDTFVLGGFPIAGNYVWQDGSTSTSLTVNSPGTYALTISNECDSDSDSILISIANEVALPLLGPDINLCPGESVVLQLNDPNASFIWQDGSTTDSLVVTTAGEYHVTAFNNCNALSDTIIVTVNAIAPDVDLPAADTLCQGQTIVIDAGVSGVSYLWTDNSTGSSLTVNSAGTYGVIVSNACGSDLDSIVIADGGPAPLVELGIDVAFCSGDTINITPAFSNVDTWMWSNGAVTSSIEITTSGETSVIVTNSCSTSYDTINATLLPAIPSFSLGNDTAVCANENVSLSINVPAVNITWSDGSTNPNLAVSTSGQYFATISNACGSFADTIEIAPLPPIPPLDLGNDQSLCAGELIIIEPGILNVDYLWHDGSTGTSFSTTQATTIVLTISNACGLAIDTIEVIESTQGPDVDLGPDIIGCAGEEVIIQAGISGVSYTWQDGSLLPTLTTNTSGEYILNVSNNCGTDADTIIVDLSGVAPVVALNADTSLCEGEILLLEITANPTDDVVWQDGSGDTEFEVNTAGTYHVAINNNCGVASDTIQIDYIAAPAPFDLGNDTVLCSGESIVLIAPVTANQIQWQDGSNAPTYTANQSQLYSLQVSNACGVVSDEINLTFISTQPNIDFEEYILICPGDVITLDATQPFPAQYAWSTGSTDSQIEVVTPGTYSVTVFTDCGDISQAVIITAADDCSPKTTFYIPNIFSPNGDGLNDVFEIKFNNTAEVESVSGQIYDRWGNLLFSSETNPFQWDGTSHGSPLNPGVFVYRFMIRYSNGVDVVTEQLMGDVTIVY